MGPVGRTAKRLKLDVSAIRDRVEAMLYAVCIRLEVQARNTLLVRGRQSEMSDSLSHHDVSLASLCLKADISEFNVHLEQAYTYLIYSHIATMAEDDFIPLDPSSSTGKIKKPRAERVK